MISTNPIGQMMQKNGETADDREMFVGVFSSILKDLGYDFEIMGQNQSDFCVALRLHSGNVPIIENFTIVHKGKGIVNFDRGRFPDINLADPNSIEVLKTLLLVAPTILAEDRRSESALRQIAEVIRKTQLMPKISPEKLSHTNVETFNKICAIINREMYYY